MCIGDSVCVESKQGKRVEERVLGRTNLCKDSMVCKNLEEWLGKSQ